VKNFRISSLLLLFVLLFSSGFAAEVLAKVNGQEIYLQEFQNVIQNVSLNSNEQIPGNSQSRMSVLEDMIKNILVAQEAEKMEIEVSTKDVRQTVRILEKSFPSKKEFQEALIQEGVYDEEGLYRGIQQQMLIDSIQERLIADVKISDKEIESYIEDNQNQFNFARKLQIYQIIISTENLAVEVYEKLLAGAEFKELAITYSEDEESRRQGGLVGYIEEDLLQPEILYALSDVSKNEIAGPLSINDQYYLVKYDSVIDPQEVDMQEIRQKIADFLVESRRDQIFNQWFDDIRDAAQVKINRKYHDYLKEKI